MTGLLDLDLGIKLPGTEGGLTVSAVILAAGRSSRMGGEAKLLLDAGGMPMIRRTVRNALAVAPVETVVVTGHGAEAIEAALAGLPVRFVRNPRHEEGQPTSVAVGVGALRDFAAAVIVMLGDQPLVTPADLDALIAAYRSLERGSILVPHHKGRRGNPIVFAARHIPAVVSGGVNIGCRKLIETHGEDVARVEFDSDAFVLDCDTPEDYQHLRARFAAGVE